MDAEKLLGGMNYSHPVDGRNPALCDA